MAKTGQRTVQLHKQDGAGGGRAALPWVDKKVRERIDFFEQQSRLLQKTELMTAMGKKCYTCHLCLVELPPQKSTVV